MKHSSHQIRGNCTYYFALEPGITFALGRDRERVAAAVTCHHPCGRLGRNCLSRAASWQPAGAPSEFYSMAQVLGDLKMKDLVDSSLQRCGQMAMASLNLNLHKNWINDSEDQEIDALIQLWDTIVLVQTGRTVSDAAVVALVWARLSSFFLLLLLLLMLCSLQLFIIMLQSSQLGSYKAGGQFSPFDPLWQVDIFSNCHC